MTMIEYVQSYQFWASVVLVLAAGVLLLIQRFFVRRLKQHWNLLDTSGRRVKIISVTAGILKVVFVLMFVTLLLQINGINVGSLIAGLGVTGIIVGFALQDVLKDVMMGVDIVTNSYFSVGDIIRYKTMDGRSTMAEVTGFNMKVTKLYDLKNGSTYTICNRNISEIEVVSDWLDIHIPAPYETRKETMEDLTGQLISQILQQDPVAFAEYKGISSFGESAIYYLVRVHCDPRSRDQLKRDINGMIQTMYEEQGLSVPYNQVVIHQAKPE